MKKIISLDTYRNTIEMLYGTLVLKDSQKIVSALLKYERIQSGDLPTKANIEATNVNNITKRLCSYNILTREKVGRDVFYSLSYFAKNILELTDDFVNNIDDALHRTITEEEKEKVFKLKQQLKKKSKEIHPVSDTSRISGYTHELIKDVPGQ